MIRLFVAALVGGLAFIAEAAAQQQSEFWYIGMSSGSGGRADTVTFIDATRIQTTGATRRAWLEGHFAPHHVERTGVTHLRALWEFDCDGRRQRTLQGTAYYADANEAPTTEAGDLRWEYAVPDTAGEWSLDFVCGDRASWMSSDRFVQMRADRTTREMASFLFSMANRSR